MRHTTRTLVASAIAVTCAFSAAATDRTGPVTHPPVQYHMTGSYTHGCFDPCACPVMTIEGLSGGFTLTETSPPGGLGGVLRTFDVTGFHLAGGVPGTISITGSGTYQIFAEFAVIQSMLLDLSVDGGAPIELHSGAVPLTGFPAINLSLSMTDGGCVDTIVSFSAAPVGSSADLNGDGHVDGADLALLLGGWGGCPLLCVACCCPTDLNCDGITNGLDLAMLLAAWG